MISAMMDSHGNNITQINLGFLAPKKKLWFDSNGDGYPDQLGLFLRAAPNLYDGRIWAELCNLAARLAIETTAFIPPMIASTKSLKVNCLIVHSPLKSYTYAAHLTLLQNGSWELNGYSANSIARMLESLASASFNQPITTIKNVFLKNEFDDLALLSDTEGTSSLKYGLHTMPDQQANAEIEGTSWGTDLLSSQQKFFYTSKERPRSLRLGLCLKIPKKLPAELGLALVNLIASAALEATDLTLPLAWADTRSHKGPILKVNVDENAKQAILNLQKGNVLLAHGPKRGLSRLIEYITRLWFDVKGPGNEALFDWFERNDSAFQLVAGQGLWGDLAHRLALQDGKPLPPIKTVYKGRLRKACRALGIELPPSVAHAHTITRQTSWKDEIHRILDLAKRVPQGSGSTPLQGIVMVSKPKERRQKLVQKLTGILHEKGYNPQIKALNAYKPGLSWLLEEVYPEIPREATKAHLSVCSYDSGDTGQLELKSRWMQEIYPGPDILAQKLSWEEEQIQLSVEPAQKSAYHFKAWDEKGLLVVDRRFSPRTLSFLFLPRRPNFGRVHPTCSALILHQGDRTIIDYSIPTDREVFWRRFQERWLPEIEKLMLKELPVKQLRGDLAFWEELRIEVAISETEHPLEFDEERISPMEALHEDIYFVLLEFLQAFNQEQALENPIQLGRILPVMDSRHKGKPWARITMRPFNHFTTTPNKRPSVTGLIWHKKHLGIKLITDVDFTYKQRERLCKIAESWGYNLRPLADNEILFITAPFRNLPVSVNSPPVAPPPENRILSGKDIHKWTVSLGNLPCLSVWSAGKSLQGRKILAMEANLPVKGRISVGKSRLLKPTLFVNARHHANEISGSNATLTLAWRLCNTIEGRKLLSRVNVVLVPLENADGVATLEKLLSNTPNYKLHAARYNALGVEWYDNYFEETPRFPEAKVKIELFRRWLPQYLLDLHGVPSHEWEQPFSGYLNARFREYWIPRSFIFAILPFLDQNDCPSGREAKQLAEAFSKEIALHSNIKELNKRIHKRYRRYAQAFEPELFKSSITGSIVVVPTSQRVRKTNFGDRFWPLVKSEVIAEVLDEVVSGPWLKQCSLAHQALAITMIKRLARSPKAVLHSWKNERGVHFSWLNSNA